MKREKVSRTPVAHACNPSYKGGKDGEDHGLKPAQENSSRSFLKKTIPKKCWGSCSRFRPWVQIPVQQKKKQEREKVKNWSINTWSINHMPVIPYHQQVWSRSIINSWPTWAVQIYSNTLCQKKIEVQFLLNPFLLHHCKDKRNLKLKHCNL
jgi:hypothetical protein